VSIAFPYHITGPGLTATASGDRHVIDMLYQLLFTSPGERVNRPDFGCGLLNLVFEPNVTGATGLTAVITTSVQQWLGDLIDVGRVDVEPIDSTMSITIRFVIRTTGRAEVAVFSIPRLP